MLACLCDAAEQSVGRAHTCGSAGGRKRCASEPGECGSPCGDSGGASRGEGSGCWAWWWPGDWEWWWWWWCPLDPWRSGLRPLPPPALADSLSEAEEGMMKDPKGSSGGGGGALAAAADSCSALACRGGQGGRGKGRLSSQEGLDGRKFCAV